MMYTFVPSFLCTFIGIDDIDDSGSFDIIDDDYSGDGTGDIDSTGYDSPEDTVLHKGWHDHRSFSDITFGAKEDMLPVEEIFNESNLLSLYHDPFGVYAIRHNATHGLCIDDFLDKPEFGASITEAELQDFCNQAFDALYLRHIPINISTAIPNAAYYRGLIPRMSFDDAIFINPDYASYCIEELRSTDIVLSDLAHEIGHYASHMAGGPDNTFQSEKIADFISGFLNAKFGVDVDVARKWFQLFYDDEGHGGYPVSEERWDIEAAGYHFGKHATFEDLKGALKDKHFLTLIKEYNSESSERLAGLERLKLMQTHDKTSVDILSALGMNDQKARAMVAHVIRAIRRK